jgi:hypothetical protein
MTISRAPFLNHSGLWDVDKGSGTGLVRSWTRKVAPSVFLFGFLPTPKQSLWCKRRLDD